MRSAARGSDHSLKANCDSPDCCYGTEPDDLDTDRYSPPLIQVIAIAQDLCYFLIIRLGGSGGMALGR